MIRVKTAIVTLVACMVLLAGAPAVLADQGSPGAATPTAQSQPVHVRGTIIDFSAISLTIKTKTGDFRAVKLTSDTRYFVNGQPVAQKPDFHDGEHVVVSAQREADGSLNALTVNVGVAAKSRNKRIAGTIIDFSPASLTIKTKTKDVFAVQLTQKTKYYVDGKPVSQRPDFHNGESARVLAHQEADGSLTALRVNLLTAAKGNKQIAGTITDVSPASLTIRTKTNDVFGVRLTSDTKYLVDGKPASQKPDFHNGEHVRVVAHQEADGSLNALRVYVETAGVGQNKQIAGAIIDFNPTSLTIRTSSGDVFAIQLMSNTKYFVNGKPVTQKPDFHFGERVRVVAHVEQDGSLNAARVAVRTTS